MLNYEEMLRRLCEEAGPSGFEDKVAQIAAELLKPYMDEVRITRMGSVVGLRHCGKKNAPKLMLDAHLDEIGFLITGHEDGYLRFAPLGGVDSRMLPDRELTIMTTPPLLGVVACLPPHIQTSDEMNQAQSIKELCIDVGLTQEEAQSRIPVGTPAVYRTGCAALGADLLCGKALDDRACFAIFLDMMEQLRNEELDVDIYIVGSTQEETHSTGAITAAFEIIPDMCIAVDVTHGDSPDASKEKTFPLGKGPVIGLGPNCTRWMSDRMQRLAKEQELEVQLEVMSGHSGTNAWDLQISREGVATSVLSVPLRYMHTPVEVVHREDLKHTAQLLAAFIRGLGEEVPDYAL